MPAELGQFCNNATIKSFKRFKGTLKYLIDISFLCYFLLIMHPSPWLAEQQQSICEHFLYEKLINNTNLLYFVQNKYSLKATYLLPWIWIFLIGFNVNITNDYKK